MHKINAGETLDFLENSSELTLDRNDSGRIDTYLRMHFLKSIEIDDNQLPKSFNIEYLFFEDKKEELIYLNFLINKIRGGALLYFRKENKFEIDLDNLKEEFEFTEEFLEYEGIQEFIIDDFKKLIYPRALFAKELDEYLKNQRKKQS